MTEIANDAPPQARSHSGDTLAGRLAAVLRAGAVLFLLAALLVFYSFAQPAFLNPNNLLSILQAVSVVAILGVGVTVTLAVGGFDLSIGAVAASSVMAASYAMVVWGLGAFPTVLFVLALGASVGLFNSFLIVRLRWRRWR